MDLIFKTKAVISPFLLSFQEEEISMLGEITHLQTISDDLKSLTMDPHKLPSSSEQVSLENVFFLACNFFVCCEKYWLLAFSGFMLHSVDASLQQGVILNVRNFKKQILKYQASAPKLFGETSVKW